MRKTEVTWKKDLKMCIRDSFEFIPTEDMEKCVRMLVEILTA